MTNNSNLTYKKLGHFIQLVDIRNRDLSISTLLGLSISKKFIPSVANTVGTNMKNYKIIKRNQFACSLMQVRRDKKMPVALLQDFDEAIISQAYPVFEIIDTNILKPEYLMMWFSRSEFDRHACFLAVGGVRGSLEWEDFLDMTLPVPSPEKQQEIVDEYNTISNRIKLNEQMNKKLEETAQAIYKHWFVDFEFPCLPENYKFSGASKPVYFDSIMTYKRVGIFPVPDSKHWFIYVLLCDDGSFYKGMTNDLYRRFYEHYSGQGASHTKTHKPVKIIHWEKFNTQEEARLREEELKTGFGRTWIKIEYEKFLKYGWSPKSGLPAHQTRLMMAGKMVWNDELEKEIPEGWSLSVIRSLCDIGSSKRIYEYEYCENGIPFFRGKEITLKKAGELITSPIYISEERYKELVNKYGVITSGDILMTAVGTIGSTYMVEDEEFYFKDGNVIWFKNFVNEGLNYFLYDFMQSGLFTDLINEITIGSTQSAITISTFGSQKILIPFEQVINNYRIKSKKIHKAIALKKKQILQLFFFKNLLLSKMATITED